MAKVTDTKSNEILTESKAKFARRLDVSDSYISRLSKLDGFPLTDDGAVIVDAALSFVSEQVERGRPGRKAGSIGGADKDEYLALKCEQLRLAISKSEVELEALRGSLVPKPEAVKAIRALARIYRDHMLNFASRYGQEIAAEFQIPAGAFIGVLDARIRDALLQAAETPMPYEADKCICENCTTEG